MHEMLGNQYFLVRKYPEARNELELALKDNPTALSIKKKLIICHIQTASISRALNLFYEVISENIDSIINTDPIIENCPCPQLIYELENTMLPMNSELQALSLGMLWLYCDIHQSLKYFTMLSSTDQRIRAIIKQLQFTIKQLERGKYEKQYDEQKNIFGYHR